MDHSASHATRGALKRLARVMHLSKLSVGMEDVAQLRAAQAARLQSEGMLRHRTRMAPRRTEELTGGGSIYWIIAGEMMVRQRVHAIEPALREDGVACVALVLDPVLVEVAPRAVRAFQGWRYLRPEDAPPDLADTSTGSGEHALPDRLRRALRALALL